MIVALPSFAFGLGAALFGSSCSDCTPYHKTISLNDTKMALTCENILKLICTYVRVAAPRAYHGTSVVPSSRSKIIPNDEPLFLRSNT